MKKDGKSHKQGFLFQYVWKNKWLFGGGIIFLTSGTLLSLAIPEILKGFIDASILKEKEKALQYLGMLVVVSIGIYLLKGILYYLKECLVSYGAFKTVMEIRFELLKSLEFYPFAFYKDKKVGELVSGITNATTAVEDFLVNSLSGLFSQPLIILAILLLVFLTNWKLAMISMLVFPLMFFAIGFFGKKTRKYSEMLQKGLQKITSFFYENFSNIRIIKLFSREEDEIQRFKKYAKSNIETAMKGVKIAAVMTPVIELISCTSLALFFLYGGREIIDGRLTPGGLIKFVTYIILLVPYLKNITADYTRFQKMQGALDSIAGYVNFSRQENENTKTKELPKLQGEIHFENVHFRYEDDTEWILKELNIKVKLGESIGVVGKSGVGKTTLINLLPRLFEPQIGKILIDGQDIKDYSTASLRKQIAIVPQEALLFNETVYYNIAFGKKGAQKEEIIEAAKKANAHEFIMKLPSGYHSNIGDRGELLSAGQRQRIAIARAILREPAILIMDEATSALDAESEYLIKEALQEFAKGKTLFIVAHRLSTVANSDRILVLDQGCIVESGTHEDLLHLGGQYYHMFNKYSLGS